MRARLSLTTATGAVVRVSCHERSRPVSSVMPIVEKKPGDTASRLVVRSEEYESPCQATGEPAVVVVARGDALASATAVTPGNARTRSASGG
jgi:hypothetical protein